MNSNASRFSQIVSLDFDQAGQVASASIQVLFYYLQVVCIRFCIQSVLQFSSVKNVFWHGCVDYAAGETEGGQEARGWVDL